MRIASAMGLFQAGMTVLGYLLGMGFEQYISDIDHWIAFLLLTAIGIKAIYESFTDREEPPVFRTFSGHPNHFTVNQWNMKIIC